MKFVKTTVRIIRFIAGLGIFAFALCFSCANPGAGPSGGPSDSIPPVILRSVPVPNQTNYTAKTVTLDFDEFVIVDKIPEVLVVSPPLAKKPVIKMRGKSISLVIDEDLIPDRTYSFDFKNSIKDNNEGNPIESYRMIFSTGNVLDTLRVSGYVVDAFTLSPVKEALVSIYELEADSAFRKMRPDYISKTDEKGFFLFDNLQSKGYKIYALKDGNSDLKFSQESEAISFVDSLVVPSAVFEARVDTILHKNDTIISSGYTHFFPDDLYMLMFTEDPYHQYLVTSKRSGRELLSIKFNESVLNDSLFSYELLNPVIGDSTDWKYEEYSEKHDSINIWISDSLVSGTDTIRLKVNYQVKALDLTDSLRSDTLQMVFKTAAPRGKNAKDEDVEKKVTPFKFSTNNESKFGLNQTFTITSAYPLEFPDTSKIHLLEQINDSVSVPVEKWKISWDEKTKRSFKFDFQKKESTTYLLKADSAAFYTMFGLPSAVLSEKITTQKQDFYGTVYISISGLKEPIVQLLKKNEAEEIVKEIQLEGDQNEAVFDYIAPGQYIVKAIADENKNGKWDTGNLANQIKPERVYYINKLLKVKSNWDLKENWTIDTNKVTPKEIVDEDAPPKKDGKSGTNTNTNK